MQLLTVPGNHDYYALGTPRTATRWDQFANGFVQWHAQDTLAAAALRPGDRAPPFDFSNDPDEGRLSGQPFGGQKPALANTFWHHSIGNVGFVGFSGAYTYEDTLPHVRQACASLGAQPDVRLLVLLGHWDVDNMGCKLSMDVPAYFERVSALPGCSGFAARGLLKFFMGHTHCNVPHPHGHVDTGFMVRAARLAARARERARRSPRANRRPAPARRNRWRGKAWRAAATGACPCSTRRTRWRASGTSRSCSGRPSPSRRATRATIGYWRAPRRRAGARARTSRRSG